MVAVVVLLVVVFAAAAGLAGYLWGMRAAPRGGAVEPVAAALSAVEAAVSRAERERVAGQAALSAEVERLRREAAALGTALRTPEVRGRWGETQLRRVLELGGALEHCDFVTQAQLSGSEGTLRPDVVVHLGRGKQLVIDAKAPLTAYLAMTAEVDEAERRQLRADHARQLRTHVQQLGSKAYWSGLSDCPEFVVLFVPGEALLDAALQADPTLQEFAFGSNVVLATPATLLALIRTVAHVWRQEQVAASAREIARSGRLLYDRLAVLGAHLNRLGGSLRSSVDHYKSLIGSLESRVLPSARRLGQQLEADSLPPLTPVDTRPRAPTAAELSDPSAGGASGRTLREAG